MRCCLESLSPFLRPGSRCRELAALIDHLRPRQSNPSESVCPVATLREHDTPTSKPTTPSACLYVRTPCLRCTSPKPPKASATLTFSTKPTGDAPQLTSQRRISPHEGQEGGSIGPASAAASTGWRNDCASPGEGVDSCRQSSQIGNPGKDTVGSENVGPSVTLALVDLPTDLTLLGMPRHRS